MPTLAGWKTYLVATAIVAYAVGGWISSQHDLHKCCELVLEGLGLGFLRAGVAKWAP